MRTALLLMVMLAPSAAVEIGPFPVVKVHDGNTATVSIDGKETKVRFLYVQAPSSSDRDLAADAADALECVDMRLSPRKVFLSAPDSLAPDPDGVIHAIVGFDVDTPTGVVRVTIQEHLIFEGCSPYWRRDGDAPAPTHATLQGLEQMARTSDRGCWGSHPAWMQERSGAE